jgi:hypothetical protein
MWRIAPDRCDKSIRLVFEDCATHERADELPSSGERRADDALNDRCRAGFAPIGRSGASARSCSVRRFPDGFRHGQPFQAGASWAVLDSGVKVMSELFAD